MKVEFSEREIQALVQMLDIAVKAGGLQLAETALILAKKFQPQSFTTEDPISTDQTVE